MSAWTLERRAKLSASLTGRTIPAAVRAKIAANSARVWAGKKMPLSARRKMSEAKKGNTPWNKGTVGLMPDISDAEREARRIRTGKRVGPLNPSWKGGVTPIRTRLWRSAPYKSWRDRVFAESEYTCQMCGAKNGQGMSVRLEADHFPVPFVVYLDRLRARIGSDGDLYEAALSDSDLWGADGRALCRRCHNTTKAGRATRSKEEEMRLAR